MPNDPFLIQIYFFITYAFTPLALVAIPLLPSGLISSWLFTLTILPLFLSLLHAYIVKARLELGDFDHISSRNLLLFHAATGAVPPIVVIFGGSTNLLGVAPMYFGILLVVAISYYFACWSAAGDSHALGSLGDLCLPLVLFVTGSTRNPRPQPSAGHNAGGPTLPPRAPGTASSNQPTMSQGFTTPAHAPGNSTHHDDAGSTHPPTRTSPASAHLSLPATGPLEFSSQSGVSHILLRVCHYLFLGNFTGCMMM